MAQQTPALKHFDLLVSRDFDPEMLDSAGLPADPEDAEIFSIDFRAESGKDYGTVVIMLNDEGELQVYCTDNVGRSMEGQDKTDWFQFLEQLKNFATRNFLSFGIKNLNRLRYSMQGQAAIKEGLFESWTGNRTTSWMGEATEARLMIRHHKNIGEGDARHRYIKSLFIETAEGERYKLPFKKLSGGRAMLEHVKSGGRPYDARGQHIVTMVEEINVLARFRRANAGQLFEGDAATLVEQTNAYYENLQGRLKSLSTARGYTSYFESWNPSDITDEEVVIESLKNLFVKQTIDTRIESALPLLARIQQQGTDMKEANIFEAWAESLTEGTWQTPDTPEKQTQLVELMSQELPVGADATNATEQLYDLLGDDELFDRLEALAEQDANADARQVIYDRMSMLSDNPDVRAVIEQLQIDPTAEMNPAEPTNPADLEPMNESVLTDDTGSTFQHILNTFKRDVKDFEIGDELSDELYNALYDYYHEDMPYGVKKARSGDPHEWVADRFAADLGIPGAGMNSPGIGPEDDPHLERESVMHGDYAEEAGDPLSSILKSAGVPAQERPAPDYMTGDMEEGMVGGALGAVAGGLVGGPAGALRGASIGSSIGDAISPDETDEAVGSHGGKPTVEYRGIFYVNQPDGSWASLKGDHVAEPAVKQVLDRMHQQSVTNEVFIDPTSKYGIDDTGAYVDLKRSAKLSADARGSATAQAAGPKIGSGGGAGGGIQPWMAGIKSVGYQGGSNPGDKLSGADPATGTPTPPATGSNRATTMPQVPPKDMGKADVIDVEEDMFGVDKDAEKQANIAAATAKNTKMVPLQPYDPAKVGGPGGPEFVPVDIKKYPMLDPEYVRSKDDYDRGFRTEEDSPLAGQYGHSGKMKPVSKDLSFLDRLKELSGLKRG